MLIALQRFGGQRPRVHPRHLASSEAQIARNCNLWEGVIRPWYRPRLEQPAINPGPIKSIYRFSDAGYWLHWDSDVDVVRGPTAGSQRLYWTGDGAPKFGNIEAIAGVTQLVNAVAAAQNFVIVSSTRGFFVGASITITLNSGTHTTPITSVQESLGRLNLQIATSGPANAGNAVVNNDKGYPHGFYAMGVPAPTNVLTAVLTANGNKGTVTGLAGVVGEGSATHTSSSNIDSITVNGVDGQGELLDFQIDATFKGPIASVQTQAVTVRVIRDPGTADEKIFERSTQTTFQGPAASDIPQLINPADVYWTGAVYMPIPGAQFTEPTGDTPTSTAEDHPHFQFTPSSGVHSYKLEIQHGFVVAEGQSWEYTLRLSIRKNQELGVVLDTVAHGLKEGDKVQFGGIVGTGTIGDLNKGAVKVLSVSGATVFVDTQANGEYTSGGTWQQVWDDADLEARAYVYTYVATLDNLDMEGPPSLPSTIIDVGDNQSVTLTGFVDPTTLADDRPYRAIRVYRTSSGSSDVAPYLFVAELTFPPGTYVDTVRGTALGEEIPSTYWEPPPDDLTGLTELPNGGLAGFRPSTNELCLCEPYQPHAWPVAYRHSMLDSVIGIAAFGQSIAVTGKGRPTVVTGIDPAAMSEEHIELTYPNLSKRGTVDMGYGVLYPTLTGLCYIAQGVAQIITSDLFTDTQWEALNPASFVAAKFGNRYLCFYDNGTERAGFIFDPKDAVNTLTFLDVYANDVWSDPRTGRTYVAIVNASGVEEIREWNADQSAIPLEYTYRSKEFVSPTPSAVRVVKVDAETYPVLVNLYADGALYGSVEVHSNRAVRVNDARGRARKWEVEVVSSSLGVEAAYVASNMARLTQYLGG